MSYKLAALFWEDVPLDVLAEIESDFVAKRCVVRGHAAAVFGNYVCYKHRLVTAVENVKTKEFAIWQGFQVCKYGVYKIEDDGAVITYRIRMNGPRLSPWPLSSIEMVGAFRADSPCIVFDDGVTRPWSSLNEISEQTQYDPITKECYVEVDESSNILA